MGGSTWVLNACAWVCVCLLTEDKRYACGPVVLCYAMYD